ncbi:hypothetical protein BJ508DRAFT_143463 [Ascobolus immersus RN42]|uniref:Uncharacterized protein n=1 Tax=Ascobolus immersus RN42 TaxID=1160509 RepID=A0A3N4I1J8_ASCIM|nr:hypothetical protein BJ508DRAFT_143463 [Ascobolus immersus RN42]
MNPINPIAGQGFRNFRAQASTHTRGTCVATMETENTRLVPKQKEPEHYKPRQTRCIFSKRERERSRHNKTSITGQLQVAILTAITKGYDMMNSAEPICTIEGQTKALVERPIVEETLRTTRQESRYDSRCKELGNASAKTTTNSTPSSNMSNDRTSICKKERYLASPSSTSLPSPQTSEK